MIGHNGTGKGVAVMIKKKSLAVAMILLPTVLSGCFGQGVPSAPPPASGNQETSPGNLPGKNNTNNGGNDEPDGAYGGIPDPILEQLGRLTLDEKIGQMVLVGMDGTLPNAQTNELIGTHHVGGFIFFKPNIQNPAQAVKLFNGLKATNKAANTIPLFMSVDEEGGRVSRLPDTIVKLPASAVIGNVNNPQFVWDLGKILGDELKAFGLNVDFAPVLDVNSNPGNFVIGDRSFSSKAPIVSRLGVQEMKALASRNVISVVKHFPGHGDTSVDSHLGLPIVSHDLHRLRSLELIPFADAVREGADMVMVAHILLPKLDSDHPASFSKPIITDLLRKELGFKGVVITDDMTMGAIVKHYDIGTAAVQSIKAGGNIVLVGHEFEKQTAVIRALKQAAAEGSLSQIEIDNRVYQILALKQKYKLADKAVVDVDVQQLNKDMNAVLQRYSK